MMLELYFGLIVKYKNMSKDIIKIKSVTGKVLYSSSNPDINKVIQEAIDKKVNLDNANLSGLSLKDIDFYNVVCDGISFNKSHLSYITFNKCVLNNISYLESTIDHCDFSNSMLNHNSYNYATLIKCNYIYDIIDNTDFTLSNIDSTSFASNVIDFTFFKDSKFYGGYFYKNTYSNITGLEYAHNVPYIDNTYIPEGSLIGWKVFDPLNIIFPPVIIKLEIPKDALRVKCINDTCRCNKARVLEFQNRQEQPLHNVTSVINVSFAKCTYSIGDIVEPNSYDSNPFYLCGHGINFFLNKKEALRITNLANVQMVMKKNSNMSDKYNQIIKDFSMLFSK